MTAGSPLVSKGYGGLDRQDPFTSSPGALPGDWESSASQSHSGASASPHPSQKHSWEDIDEAEDSMSSRPAGPSTPRRGSEPSSRSGASSPSKRLSTTPVRRRKPPRPARPAVASRTELRSSASHQIPPSVWSATLSGTSSVILAITRFAVSLLQILLEPIFFPLIYTFIAVTIISLFTYYLLPHIPNFLLLLVGKLLRVLGRKLLPSFPAWGDSDVALGADALAAPFRAVIATPACALAGVLCPLSIATTLHPKQDNALRTAKPFWQWDLFPSVSPRGDAVDVGRIAMRLTKEVKQARDIFDSVRSLGDGSLIGGLEYVRIWELGVAVQTGSNLEDKVMVGNQLMELGDMTRDLFDEIGGINNMAVNAFNWIHWEFDGLVNLLSPSNPQRPSNETVTRRIHTLVVRLDTALQTLHHLTSQSTLRAQRASSHGQELLRSLHFIKSSLEREKARDPLWRRAIDVGKHQLMGGEPTRTELIARDLDITRTTIGSLDSLRLHLETVRSEVKRYRDQIGLSQASVMGVHLGVSESAMEAEDEVRMLAELVEGLGAAVGRAKARPLVREERGPLAIEGKE